MSTVISTAAREYATRPADERFASLEALIANAAQDKQLSAERTYNLRDLSVTTRTDTGGQRLQVTDHNPSMDTLQLQSPKGYAAFSHWSFGQLCRSLGAPASYLRTLPPAIAAEALNYGLHDAAPAGSSMNLLVRAPNGRPEPLVRACTSDSYGRLWDADLYSGIAHHFRHDDAWKLPPSWTGDPMGAYRGDRDSFVTICNGGSIVTDPSLAQGKPNELYRGLLIRNSEVGAASVSVECILYEYVCGNNNYWGAVIDKRFKRRHVGTRVLRDSIREIADIAFRWTQRSAAADEAIIRGLIDHEIAHTKDAVIDELRKIGYSKDAADAAYAQCEKSATFTASPRSFWGIAQGTTQLSQDTSWQDDRMELDKLAALVLARGAKLVRV